MFGLLFKSNKDHAVRKERKNFAGGVFDKAALMERIDNDEKLYRQLCDLFKVEMHEALSHLQEAIRQPDYSRIAFYAHLIKGQCGNMGAIAMQGLARKIEQAARQPAAIESIADRAALLEKMYTEVKLVL